MPEIIWNRHRIDESLIVLIGRHKGVDRWMCGFELDGQVHVDGDRFFETLLHALEAGSSKGQAQRRLNAIKEGHESKPERDSEPQLGSSKEPREGGAG